MHRVAGTAGVVDENVLRLLIPRFACVVGLVCTKVDPMMSPRARVLSMGVNAPPRQAV